MFCVKHLSFLWSCLLCIVGLLKTLLSLFQYEKKECKQEKKKASISKSMKSLFVFLLSNFSHNGLKVLHCLQ